VDAEIQDQCASKLQPPFNSCSGRSSLRSNPFAIFWFSAILFPKTLKQLLAEVGTIAREHLTFN
jgi:hypothetical protein